MNPDSNLVLFATARLRVRRLVAADEEAMFAVYSDSEGAKYVDDGEPILREEVGPWIAKTQQNYRDYGYGMMTMEYRETGEVVGFIGLVHPGGQVEVELKYSLGRAWWGQGLASEAVVGAVDYGRQQQGLREIIATVDPEHLASQRVLTKAGFEFTEDREEEDGSITRVMTWRVER